MKAKDKEPADQDGERSLELVQTGSEMAGAAVGGAIGLIGGPIGVPLGAVGGVVATRVFKKVGSELQARIFGPRQRVRVGAAFTFAADQINTRLEAGEELRDDGFFASEEG